MFKFDKISCINKRFHPSIHPYMAIHDYTQLHTAIHDYTQLYTAIHDYTQLYTAIHGYTQCNVLKLTKECQNIQRDEQTRETVRHVSEHPRMRSACFNRMMQYSVPVSNVSSSDYVTYVLLTILCTYFLIELVGRICLNINWDILSVVIIPVFSTPLCLIKLWYL